MNDSERWRAGEGERTEKVDDRFVFIGEKGIERAPGRKRTHELIMATCVPPPSPRFLSLGSSRFARPVREAGSRAYVVFCIAPQRGRLMATVMQRDCPFHGALRGKTHVATGETHANDTRTCTS